MTNLKVTKNNDTYRIKSGRKIVCKFIVDPREPITDAKALEIAQDFVSGRRA